VRVVALHRLALRVGSQRTLTVAPSTSRQRQGVNVFSQTTVSVIDYQYNTAQLPLLIKFLPRRVIGKRAMLSQFCWRVRPSDALTIPVETAKHNEDFKYL